MHIALHNPRMVEERDVLVTSLQHLSLKISVRQHVLQFPQRAYHVLGYTLNYICQANALHLAYYIYV